MDAESLIEVLDLDPWTALDTLNEDEKPDQEPSEPAELDSASNFESIGNRLRSQRDTLGLTLEDVAQHTHLRIRYLKALEAGKISALPSTVQGRGMLKNYAVFLGLDSDKLLLHFAEGLQIRLVETTPKQGKSQVRPKTRPNFRRRERRLLSRDLIIGIVLALSLVAFIIWGTIQVTALRSAGDVEPTAPSIADVLLPSSTPSLIPTWTPTLSSQIEENGAPGVIVENPVSQATQEVIFVSDTLEGAVQVQIVARQRAWMRIIVDGEVEFDGRTIPGNIYGFAGEDYVEIRTGNAAGLQVFYNDLDLGTLGNFGEVVNFVITVNGVQTPTPTITLTPTPTLTLTGTLEATPTP
jgi:cytoskeletal protein RodZ